MLSASVDTPYYYSVTYCTSSLLILLPALCEDSFVQTRKKSYPLQIRYVEQDETWG